MRKTSLIFISFFICFIANEAYCDIEFQGNFAVSDRELLKNIDPDASTLDISNQIKKLYQNKGYFDVSFEREYTDPSQNRIFVINEGKLSRISIIDLSIAPDSLGLLLDDLRNMFVRRAASRNSFREFAESSVSILADNGMPFARGEWVGFGIDENDNIIASFKIVPGPYTIISDFEFNGVKRTKPDILEKAAGLKRGEPFSKKETMRSEKMMEKLQYIEISSPYYLEASVEGDSCTIVYNIRELPSTRMEGFGGLINIKGKTDFIGRVNFEFGDILGTGRAFSLFWNKKDARSNELSVKYIEPFILNSRLNLELEAYQLDLDTLYVTTGGRASVIHNFGIDLTGIMYTSIERTVPESGSNVSRSLKRSIGMEFDYDKTDFAPNPKSGYEIGSGIEYRYRSNSMVLAGQSPPSNVTSAGLNGAYYLKFTGRAVTAVSFRGWGIVSANGVVPVDEYRFIGGVHNLRGYTEQQFPAYRYAIFTAEPRLIAGKYSRAYLFGDFGLIKGSQDRDDEYSFKPGFGLGLVSRSRIGQVKVEIGWGDVDFPSDPVFNFGIGGNF
jgi:outer membrane protein assembly factor BamA